MKTDHKHFQPGCDDFSFLLPADNLLHFSLILDKLSKNIEVVPQQECVSAKVTVCLSKIIKISSPMYGQWNYP